MFVFFFRGLKKRDPRGPLLLLLVLFCCAQMFHACLEEPSSSLYKFLERNKPLVATLDKFFGLNDLISAEFGTDYF